MGMENVLSEAIHGMNAITFSLFGMSVVFCGLLTLSVTIYLLPKFLSLFEKKEKKPVPGDLVRGVNQDKEDEDILLAVAVAFHLQSNFVDENMKITWNRHGESESAWHVHGKAQNLSMRTVQSVRNTQPKMRRL